jgi:DNA-directed RNA polymerase subunit RPC12/RpoP
MTKELKFKCVICGDVVYDDYGNNPQPITDKGRCCDYCNVKVVIPARVEMAGVKL